MEGMTYFGWGVIAANGIKESDCVMDEQGAARFAHVLNSLHGDWTARGPFRPAELFYKEEP